MPDGLGAIAASRSSELRFLGEAFDRLAREYPSTRDGLSLTERRLLAAVVAGAPDAGTAFARASARECRPYLGDTVAFEALARLATGAHPLVTTVATGADVGPATRVRPTEAGEQVLTGAADLVRLNGIDRRIGGVHLAGPAAAWRFDEGTESVVVG